MFNYYQRFNINIKVIIIVVVFFFGINNVCPSYALAQGVLGLPVPGTMVSLSPAFTPAILRGIRVYPNNSLKFDFIVDSGDTGLIGTALEDESQKLIKYFLAALTIPEDNLWVNLSPYEKDRIVPAELGSTEMGVDMLAQDYLLKQITASLTNPDSDLGKEFWSKIYKKAYEAYGTTDIPVDTFNKVWIMPDKAEVYVKEDRAFVVEARLKVMLEEDYLALENSIEHVADNQDKNLNADNKFASDIVREIVIPALEKEVNEGKNFAQLRQIYNAIILSYWYKTNLKDSILNKVYSDQKRVKGIDLPNKGDIEKIYAQYLETFKKGVCDMVKVEYDPCTKANVPRKYFAGGIKGFGKGIKPTFLDGNTPKGKIAGSAILAKMRKSFLIMLFSVSLITFSGDTAKQVHDQGLEIFKEGSKKWWLSLARENYRQILERLDELKEKDFASDVLKEIMLTTPTGPYASFHQIIYQHMDKLMANEKFHPFVKWLIKTYPNYGYLQLNGYLDKPYASEILYEFMLSNPAELMAMIISENSDYRTSYFYRDFRFDLAEKKLRLNSDTITKAFLKIYDLSVDMETKSKMCALLPLIGGEKISISEAAEIVKNNDLYIHNLSVLWLDSKNFARVNIRDQIHQAFREKISEWATNIIKNPEKVKKNLNTFSYQEVFYALTILGNDGGLEHSIIRELFKTLYEDLLRKIKDNGVLFSSLLTDSFRYQEALNIIMQNQDFFSFFVDQLFEEDLIEVALKIQRSFFRENGYYSMFPEYKAETIVTLLKCIDKLKQLYPHNQRIGEQEKEALSVLDDFVSTKRGAFYFLPNLNLFSDLSNKEVIYEKIKLVLFDMAENPSYEFFQSALYYYEIPYASHLISLAARQSPRDFVISNFNGRNEVKRNFWDSPPEILSWLNKIDDTVIKNLIKIREYPHVDYPIKQLMALLLDDLLQKNLSLQQAADLSQDPILFMRRLHEIQSREGHLAKSSIEKYLSNVYLKMVRTINNLHEESDEIRFASIENANTQDLYYLITYGEQEIFTSSFNGIFDRLLIKMNEDSLNGEQLLRDVNYYNFRGAIRLMAEFNRLNDFFEKCSLQQKTNILRKFVSNIEKKDYFLSQAVVIADVFSILKDKETLEILQRLIKQEYQRVEGSGSKEGKAVYGLLNGLFAESAVIDAEWFKKMSEKYYLPSIDVLPKENLFNNQKINLQQYYFYSDEDGRASFDNFIKQYKGDPNWRVYFEKDYVQISSAKGKRVEIFANRPSSESEGMEKIDSIFVQKGFSPQVVVHRGHSYHVPKTLGHITDRNFLVVLGSCGGFGNVTYVLDRSPDAHIFSTKGAGSKWINDPLLKLINEQIRTTGELEWDKVWLVAWQRLKRIEGFNNYIPPHKNLSVFFIKAYKRIVEKEDEKEKIFESNETSQNDIDGYGIGDTFFWVPNEVSVSSDAAMLGEDRSPPMTASSSLKGGIDFNAENMNVTSRGDKIDFNVPENLQNISSSSIQGFVPVIISIVPVTNFIGLLGLDDTENQDNERLSYASDLIGDKHS